MIYLRKRYTKQGLYIIDSSNQNLKNLNFLINLKGQELN